MVSYFGVCNAPMGLIGVLILIVMDNGLVHIKDNGKEGKARSLNPYCSGQWSRTLANYGNAKRFSKS